MLKIVKVFLVFFLFCSVSCTPPPPPQLSADMKSRLDSLYTFSLDSIKTEIELECQKRHSSIYQLAVDSFQTLRREEFESILAQ